MIDKLHYHCVMKDKTFKKRKSGTLTIDPELVTEISNFCKKKGIILKFFVEELRARRVTAGWFASAAIDLFDFLYECGRSHIMSTTISMLSFFQWGYYSSIYHIYISSMSSVSAP